MYTIATPWIFLCTALSVVMGQYSINMRISSTRVQEGDTVNATCKVHNQLNKAVLLYWIKRVGTEEVDIATGPQLMETFRKTGRYHVEQDAVNSLKDFVFTLRIKDAKAEDTGEIGCRIPNQNYQVFKNLTVISQIQSVKLSSVDVDVDKAHLDVYADGSNATFEEGEVRKFSCHVNGSYPKPTVQMRIGDTDITHLFTEKAEEVIEGITRGRYYKVDLYNDALEIGYTFNGKNLTCTAWVHQPPSHQLATLTGGRVENPQDEPVPVNTSKAGYPPVSASVEIVLTGYRPQFLCGQTFTASLHQRDVALECEVQAQPLVSKARFHYTVLGVMNQTIDVNQTFGRYSGKLIEEDDNRQKAVLKIALVFPQHFRRYYFEATNLQGTTIHEVELRNNKPDSRSQAPPGGGGGWCSVSVLIFSLVSLSIVNTVLN